jgi:Icc-related predicted phosphoesterase
MEKNLVFISDTHGLHDRIEVPDGDILIHCGDISSRGLLNEVTKFSNWFCKLPHKHKVIIPGNHDFIFEKNNQIHKELFEDKGVTFLNDSQTEIEGIKIWGSPITPYFHNWAFNLPRQGWELEQKWKDIPEETDILITHGPAYGFVDTVMGRPENLGCELLAKRIASLKPSIHVCGHIHTGYGYKFDGDTHFFNAAVLDEQYYFTQKPFTVEWNRETNEVEFL